MRQHAGGSADTAGLRRLRLDPRGRREACGRCWPRSANHIGCAKASRGRAYAPGHCGESPEHSW
eukprot:15016796-Alexandrium_andersonii.AAC.1